MKLQVPTLDTMDLNINRDDIIYTAALVDGEGSVLLDRSRASENRYPAVTIPSTTYAFMKFLKTTFGGTVSRKRVYKKTHKKSWAWSVRGNAALELLKRLIAFMKEPEKVRRARLLLMRYKVVTAPNGKYTPALLKARRQFERKFFNKYAR